MYTTTPRGSRPKFSGGQHLGALVDPLGRPTILFDPEGEGQGGTGAGGGGEGGAGQGSGDGGAGQQFTPITSQADLDRTVGERLARERAKFADYDDLKAKASKWDEAEQANQTEQQRLQAERDAERARADQASAALRSTRVESALISEAAKAGARNPQIVATMLANSNAVTIDDAGQVTGADTAVNTLKQSDGYLFGESQNGSGGGAGGSTSFGGGQGRGGAGEPDKGSVAKGAELHEQLHKKKTTSNS